MLGLDGAGRLLDIGCGPGILVLRLARLFEEAIGLDPDPDMLVEGRKEAASRDATKVRWVQALAEDLPETASGLYRLVTFGQSFHWTDEQRVAEVVYDMLEPGGSHGSGRAYRGRAARAEQPRAAEFPHEEIKAVVEKYVGSTRRAGQGSTPVRTHRFEDVLVRTRFGPPRTVFAPGKPDLVRDTDSVLSGYFSMASSAPHLYGERLDEFPKEVTDLLAARSSSGLFWDWPGDTEIVLTEKPR